MGKSFPKILYVMKAKSLVPATSKVRHVEMMICFGDGDVHSCWRASFLAFCLGGRPAIYTIYIPYISMIYSMCTYNYIHIWRAARNVKNSPANNYGDVTSSDFVLANISVRSP